MEYYEHDSIIQLKDYYNNAEYFISNIHKTKNGLIVPHMSMRLDDTNLFIDIYLYFSFRVQICFS